MDLIPDAKQAVLLYRGTRDSFKSFKFRENCSNKGSTLSILRTISKEKSIEGTCGGFTDIPWSNQDNYSINNQGKSFLFKINSLNQIIKLNHRKGMYETLHKTDELIDFHIDLKIKEDCDSIASS